MADSRPTPARALLVRVMQHDTLDTVCCTHFVIPLSQLEGEFMTDVFMHKQENRTVKTLLELNGDDVESMGLKDFLKLLTQYGFDGFVLTLQPSHKTLVQRLLVVLSKLPAPYDFAWNVFLKAKDVQTCLYASQLRTCAAIIRLIVKDAKLLTDVGYAPSNIVLEGNVQMVKDNKFGGLFVANVDGCDAYYSQLQHSLCQAKNNVEYPTSRFLKQFRS